MNSLPSSYRPYIDKYFLRSLEILEKEKLNPYIRAQCFIRKGPGRVYGIREAINVLLNYTKFEKNGGRIYSILDESLYSPSDTLIVLEGKAQDIIPLETMMLGIISEKTSVKNDGLTIDFETVTHKFKTIKTLVQQRSLLYFGARHFHFDNDALISHAAFLGGASDCSTDIGAKTEQKQGVGTIPHSLECIYAWKNGYVDAVLNTLRAFDEYIDISIPRIALVDFANREVDDSLSCAVQLRDRLFGIRIDTCGENIMQGSSVINGHTEPYWYGSGVTVSGVYAVRKRLNESGFPNIKIILSSGFGDIEKVQAFINAEKELGIELFSALGIGEVLPVRSVTMDVVAVGESINSMQPVSKIGRVYKPNRNLQRIV